MVAQREARVDAPQPTDLFAVGSLAVVHKVVQDAQPEPVCVCRRPGAGEGRRVHPAARPLCGRRWRRFPRPVPPKNSEDGSAAAQCADAVPADRGGVADVVGRAFHGGDEYRRAGTPGGLCRLLAAVAFHPRQAGHAGDPRRAGAAGEDQPASGQGAGSSAAAQQDSVAKCRTACSRRSANTTCASR